MATRFILSRRTYSEPVIIPEDEYLDYLAEKIYSKDSDKEKFIRDLKSIDINSTGTETHRGLGRSIVFGGPGPGGVIGGYLGKRHASKLAKENPDISDEDLLRRSTLRGAGSGLAVGATGAYLTSRALPLIPKGMAKYAAGLGGVTGAIGGALGSRKNVKERMRKRDALRHDLINKELSRIQRERGEEN